jgi:hypothetical protein
MRRLHSLIGVISILLATAGAAGAQSNGNGNGNGEGEDFVRDVLAKVFGPNWNIFAHAGPSTSGRFLLQGAVGPNFGQRALRADDSFHLGGGVGVDLLPRVGFRLSYTYTNSDLVFRTDDGDGSETFDADDGGSMKTHLVAMELIRYMLPARVFITPYGSAGLVGAWWMLDQESAMITPSGGATQFRVGALASFGLQMRLAGGLHTRLEVTSASVRNPFTGSESFRALGGDTIDEPGRVNKTDFRVAAIYSFGRP